MQRNPPPRMLTCALMLTCIARCLVLFVRTLQRCCLYGKVSQYALLPQGRIEGTIVLNMVSQMDKVSLGTNTGAVK
jgi:hypothetical protein